jgi:Mrp family chromosome partitioning ATPase/DUF971 family protein
MVQYSLCCCCTNHGHAPYPHHHRLQEQPQQQGVTATETVGSTFVFVLQPQPIVNVVVLPITTTPTPSIHTAATAKNCCVPHRLRNNMDNNNRSQYTTRSSLQQLVRQRVFVVVFGLLYVCIFGSISSTSSMTVLPWLFVPVISAFPSSSLRTTTSAVIRNNHHHHLYPTTQLQLRLQPQPQRVLQQQQQQHKAEGNKVLWMSTTTNREYYSFGRSKQVLRSFWPNKMGVVASSSLFSSTTTTTTTTTSTTTDDNNNNNTTMAMTMMTPPPSQDTNSTAATTTSNSDHNTSTTRSRTIPMEWQGRVLDQLRTIVDPDLQVDIVTLGFVQNLQIQQVLFASSSTMSTISDDDDDDLVEETKQQEDNVYKTIVSFNVQLTTPACPIREQFQLDCERNVLQLSWVDDVIVNMTSRSSSNTNDNIQQQPQLLLDPLLSGMSQVGAIIAVSSCKGGVGKSTTAVNLAFALQQLGSNINIGIFDADVYGPSLPTMVKPDNDVVQFIGRQIAPLSRNNVKLMSFGYVSDDAAIMRGPIVTQLIDQIIGVTQWGKLDYMIIDMPPGTGDIPLTLTQRLNITAAVIVTTPQELSYTDVVRGINMFDSVNVPCIAVVENMAYYEINTTTSPKYSASDDDDTAAADAAIPLDMNQLKASFMEKLQNVEEFNDDDDVNRILTNGDGTTVPTTTTARSKLDALANELIDLVQQQLSTSTQRTRQEQDRATPSSTTTTTERVPIFGMGHAKRLSDQFGIEHVYSIPLLPKIAANGDSGTPYILEHPKSVPSTIYQQLAASVVQEVAKIQYMGTSQRPMIEYDNQEHEIVVNNLIPTTGSVDPTLHDTTIATTTTTMRMKPAHLRRACRCASCVEEMTGRQILIPSTISETIYPRKMYPTGNYALSVDWSDGHRSLYPYRQIKALIEES